MAKHETMKELKYKDDHAGCKRAKGGRTPAEEKGEETGPKYVWNKGPSAKEADEKEESFKRGGAAKKKKHAGHAEGHKAEHRLDKRARGGSMKGHSPFSHASNVTGRPGGDYDGENGKNSMSGHGPKLDESDD